jgi:acetolactate synthase-1/2/3 large subunit
MKGSEYVAKFLSAIGADNVYLVQGGACAFMLDSIALEPGMGYTCFQNEQGAAMAADAVWRINGKLGVTMCTSGPGASNLITGIACSYYDSIPSLHICGQVNGKEVAQYRGAKVRQAGFQQMDIVTMTKPITKYAVAITNAEELRRELKRCVEEAFTGRMGPVVIDIPMDVQTEDVGEGLDLPDMDLLRRAAHVHWPIPSLSGPEKAAHTINEFFADAKRPLVVFGAGPGLAGTQKELETWLREQNAQFVASWSGMTFFNHDIPGYAGHFGVYGNRGGNYAIQNADKILVIGSRLDNRQRSGNPSTFAPNAKFLVLDIDKEELLKYDPEQYRTVEFDCRQLPEMLTKVTVDVKGTDEWRDYIQTLKSKYFNKDTSTFAKENNALSPYLAVQAMQGIMDTDAISITDAGANHCYIYQMFYRNSNQYLLTSSGHYAMGYSVPAAVGCALSAPGRQVISFNGDGGVQMNIQELQTIKEYGLDVKVVVFNNFGLCMIKQFQDSYMGGRHEATGLGKGPGSPNFVKIADAYDMDYARVETLDQITADLLKPGARLIEIILDEGTLIEPKLEMGRQINDQFPYVTDNEFAENNKFVPYARFKSQG